MQEQWWRFPEKKKAPKGWVLCLLGLLALVSCVPAGSQSMPPREAVAQTVTAAEHQKLGLVAPVDTPWPVISTAIARNALIMRMRFKTSPNFVFEGTAVVVGVETRQEETRMVVLTASHVPTDNLLYAREIEASFGDNQTFPATVRRIAMSTKNSRGPSSDPVADLAAMEVFTPVPVGPVVPARLATSSPKVDDVVWAAITRRGVTLIVPLVVVSDDRVGRTVGSGPTESKKIGVITTVPRDGNHVVAWGGGDSGGKVLNGDGQVVAIITSGPTDVRQPGLIDYLATGLFPPADGGIVPLSAPSLLRILGSW